MEIDISLAISITAFILSLVTIYFQWFRVRGAKIELLNTNDKQRSIVRYYAGLPSNIQDAFPNYPDIQSGHGLVKLVFGNSGDRAGIASIQKIEIKNAHELIKSSYYSYILVPAYEIVEKDILLRNIPIGPHSIEVEIVLTIEWGGYHPRSGGYLHKGIMQKTLQIDLIPPPENPPRGAQLTSLG